MPVSKPDRHDDLLRFAARHGANADDIRAHEKNRALFSRRGSTLHESDEVFVPQSEGNTFQLEAGKTHVLVYAPPQRVLHLQLRNDDGDPLHADYTLADIEYDDTATGDEPTELHGYAHEGRVYEELPAATLRAKLVLDDAEEEAITLEFGRLDPVTKQTGVLQRLATLGLYLGPSDADLSHGKALEAVRLFQRENGLAVTGDADHETRTLLAKTLGA